MTATLAQELATIPTFQGLAEEALEWLASRMQTRTLAPGELLAQEGEPVEFMSVVLEGEIRGRHENGSDDGRTFTAQAGQVSGMLPFSRLTHFPLTVRAAMASRVALFPARDFPEIQQRVPELQQRLVHVLTDRIRETTAWEQQREKMVALGKLSAGLAHELNNPAAAARRASQTLREAVEDLRLANMRLDELDLSAEQRRFLAAVEHEATERDAGSPPLDSLERSDREQLISGWLEERGIRRSWELASGLVEAGADLECLSDVAQRFPLEALSDVLVRFTITGTVKRLVNEIENSTGRISDLVRAVKEYSYMDQMPEQEMDIHHGIESTLLILKHRWKHGIEIIREFDRTLPPVCAKGSELNQVWTNLIDNAIDAMSGKGVLRIRTAREADSIIVEIRDNGPGVPPAIQSRIFEPFFTTKPVGEGTGLGLDTVYRIVRSHHGGIRLVSHPGDTRFEVRLPIASHS